MSYFSSQGLIYKTIVRWETKCAFVHQNFTKRNDYYSEDRISRENYECEKESDFGKIKLFLV